MSQTYFAILTAIGEAKLANATALGTTLQLTQMGIGDGNGSTPLPNRSQTALVRENRRAPLNRLFVDPANASQIIAEQVIPEEIGGWWIREIGLYDTDGNLCAVANCPDTYKPVLAEGSGRTQVIRMVLIVSNTAAVQLKIDPAIVLATRGYVDDEFSKHLAALDPHPQYATLTVLSSVVYELENSLIAKAGDSMTGALSLNGPPTNILHAATKGYVDGNGLLNQNGQWRFPAGLILQWGYAMTPETGEIQISFPTPFPNAVLGVIATHAGSGGAAVIIVRDSQTKSSVTFRLFDFAGGVTSRYFYWLAIGH